MKQFWLGLGLVSIILVGGLFLEKNLENRHRPGAKDLELAAQCAGTEDWAQAEALVKRAGKNWEAGRNLTAAVIHHSFVEEIDRRFTELAVYAQQREKTDFCVGCAGLAQQLRDLPRIHSFTWWNLL